MIEFVFLDLDDTILDFHRAEGIALSRALRDFEVEPTQEVLDRYRVINQQHWRRLETGELTRDEVKVGRFRQLFAELGKPLDAAEVTRRYEHNLGIGHFFLPGAHETVEKLSGRYRLFLASNGNAAVQHSRLASAGLYPCFEGIFISEEVGFNKPSKAFFEACFAQIPGFAPERAVMVGDSLTSDILGGLRAGIRTCWFNPAHLPPRPDIRPDWEIDALPQLEPLLREN